MLRKSMTLRFSGNNARILRKCFKLEAWRIIMADNQEMYCRHCGKNTLFTLESDRLWYCDECENIYESISDDDEE